jgi:hypothetical protein
MTIRPRWWIALVVGAPICGIPAPAWACGGLFCQNTPVDQTGEKILFSSDGTTVTAYVQIAYQGDAKDFSWVVPVPSRPTLEAGSNSLFMALQAATRPTFRLNYAAGTCMSPEGLCVSAPPTSGGDSSILVAQDRVGPYEAATISADDPGALVKWLRTNGYVLPAKLEPLLAPYVAEKYSFVALKLAKDSAVGDISPIVLTYAATKPGIPIRLTGVAAKPDMDVFVWVLGKARAIPENYRHAVINEARIDWAKSGQNYRDVVTKAVAEAGGQAFVTDFAGESSVIPANSFVTNNLDPASLLKMTDRFAFGQAVIDGGYFRTAYGTDTAALLSFLKHYVPKPEIYADMPDGFFYGSLPQFSGNAAISKQIFDPTEAVDTLRKTTLDPYLRIQKLLAEQPYLTALYTTMSPEQMTQDPVFRFNPVMGTVSNHHVATAFPSCSEAAFGLSWRYGSRADILDIKLADGRHVVDHLSTTCVGADSASSMPANTPAAWRIEQLLAEGNPAVIVDYGATASAGLTPAVSQPMPVSSPVASIVPAEASPIANAGTSPIAPAKASPIASPTQASAQPGFGCRGCSATNGPPALSQNGGEGLAYSAIVLGYLGYRRRISRRRK